MIEAREDGKTGTLSTVQKDNLVRITDLNVNQQLKFDENPDTDKANCPTEAQGRAGSSSEYMDSVSKVAKLTGRIRRLTPIECCRLQNIDDGYFYDKEGKNIISDSAIYKAVGNGFTVDMFVHFLKYLPKQFTNE
jgi:site-specific DNA-cytosine methylase